MVKLSIGLAQRFAGVMLALGVICAASVLHGSATLLRAATDEQGPGATTRVDFLRDVFPIVEARCLTCHGRERQRGNLRLDTPSGWRDGGASGPIFVSGKGEASLIVRHVSGLSGALRMPPKGDPLTAEQVRVLRAWVDQGAKLPDALPTQDHATTVSDHWALKPLRAVQVPALPVEQGAWARTPIDAFVLDALLKNGLTPGPDTDRRVLLRRVCIDLIGLPPTVEEQSAFLADASPDAYERLVERLLASPRYGERWARHWLDVVHYADSHGQDQDRPRPNAWPYRDYLIKSFNADKPYARFVREQIAGDAAYPDDPEAIVATGFLAAGPWDESGLRDIREDSIDRQIARYLDRDDIVCSTFSTFAGLTVGCARCHDHKFDPITQEDYYGLQAVFAGIDKAERTFEPDPALAQRRKQLLEEIARTAALKGRTPLDFVNPERAAAVRESIATLGQDETAWETPEPMSWKAAEGTVLKALLDRSVLAVGQRPERDTYSITFKTMQTNLAALRVDVLCDETLPRQGPGRQDNGNLHLSEVRIWVEPLGGGAEPVQVKLKSAAADFDQAGWTAAHAIDGNPATAWGIYPDVGKPHRVVFRFAEPIGFAGGSLVRVELDQQHGGGHLIGRLRLAVSGRLPEGKVQPPLDTALGDLLAVPEDRRTPLQKAELTRWVWEQKLRRDLAALPPSNKVYCGTNRFDPDGSFKPAATPRTVHVLKRGDIHRPGALVQPGAIAAIRELPSRFALDTPEDEGSRRRALADWLTHRENPLTWRVMANRVWHYHFGRGIVDTPNDFGVMGGRPSHPELLDWLAVRLRDEGGSLKDLHRQIVTSSAYRQAVRHDPAAHARDGDNRLLWRMNRGRLDAETLRDSVLLVSGRLNDAMYGPPVQHFQMSKGVHVTPVADYDKFDVDAPEARRRSVYRYIFRTRPDPMLAALDCPDASLSAPVRGSSLSAVQALVLWNNKFTLRHAERLAERMTAQSSQPSEQVRQACLHVLGREPSAEESQRWSAYVRDHGLANFCRVLLNSSEFLFVD